MAVLHLPVFLWRDHRLRATFLDEVPYLVAVITAVRDYGVGFGRGGKALFGGYKVADVARRQMQNDRTAFIVGDRVNLAVTASA